MYAGFWFLAICGVCVAPPALSGACDRAGQPLGRAGRLGGRPGCGRGVAGMGGCVHV